MTPVGHNSLPDIEIAVAAHRIAVARRALKAAEIAARLKGVPLGELKSAIKMLSADPDKIALKQARMGSILVALKAATVSVEADLFERTSDETSEERAERYWRDGYCAAVLGEPEGGGALEGDDKRAWVEGHRAFHTALRAYDESEKASRAAA